jgi:hypothetical protein
MSFGYGSFQKRTNFRENCDEKNAARLQELEAVHPWLDGLLVVWSET